MGRVLRGESRVYVHDDSGEVHSFNPGDEIPPWAERKITNPDVWAEGDPAGTSAPAGADEPKQYSDWKKADLEEEVASRNEGRDEDDLIEVEAPGNKAELIAALVADDAAQADNGK